MKDELLAVGERRFHLRERTRSLHDRLDNTLGGFETLEQYRFYLQRLGRFRIAMDGVLKRVIWPAGWSFRPTALTSSLNKDAIDLSLAPFDDIVHSMDIADKCSLLGALYVLEGSTFGARILRQRAVALGLDETFGARHLVVMSKNLAQWEAFLLLLDEAQNFDIDRAAKSANAVFGLALRCFESNALVA